MGTSLSFRIGVVMLAGFVILQLLLIVALQLPDRVSEQGSYGLPSPQAMAQLVNAAERAGPAGADQLVTTYDNSLFTLEIFDEAPTNFREVPVALSGLAKAYRAALADHNVVVDGGPGRFNHFLGENVPAFRLNVPIRLTVWLQDGRALVLTGRPSGGLRRFLLQRSLVAAVGGAALLVLMWLALRQTTGPLRRLARRVDALGSDLRAPDAAIEGSRETRALAVAFNEMKQRIASLVEERTFILAGVAHDMRTYLTRLRLRADFIEDPDQRQRAERDLEQMAALLDDNLLFAGIEHGGVAQLQSVDLGEVTRDCVTSRVDADRIRLALEPDVQTLADRAGLERIFGNLVDNALHYADHVSISARKAADGVNWVFEDDGPGVAPDQIARLGRAYDRLDPSRNRRTGGAGLGLAIVRALVEAMGGKVAFGPAASGGLAVSLTLRRS